MPALTHEIAQPSAALTHRSAIAEADSSTPAAGDFAINPGGIIHVGAEWLKEDWAYVEKLTLRVKATITSILTRAKEEKTTPDVIAIGLAKERIANAER